ncbi:hypothetical protein GC177_00035 [bacterium]|nr:hypothetical protein [bacterium]
MPNALRFSSAFLALMLPLLTACAGAGPAEQGHAVTVAKMDINPGNAAVSRDGRIFASIHQFRPAPVRLVEVHASGSYEPFPSAAWNDASRPSGSRLVSPLGVKVDGRNRLWVIDNGNEGANAYPPKLLAFDIASRRMVFRHQFRASVAQPGSFAQDIAVDDKRGFVYVADVGKVAPPALLVVNTRNGASWRIENIPGLAPEGVNISVQGHRLEMPDANGPARIGVDPITLSADGETLFFGPMSGTSWYAVPASILRRHASEGEVAAAVRRVGPKPISDGAATDAAGNHYFTDIENSAISMLTPSGTLKTVAQDDELLNWPDSIAIGPDNKLYVASNQLHRSAFFNHGQESGQPPYRIVSIRRPGSRQAPVATSGKMDPCDMATDDGICLLSWRGGKKGKQR